MSIKVTHDGDTWRGWPMERCAFCRSGTRFWYAPKDVAVCPSCAETQNASDVPTKAEWCAKDRANKGAM